MTPELSRACSLIVEAHEAAELAVVITADALVTSYRENDNKGVVTAPAIADADSEYETALALLDHIEESYGIARQAMERDALRSNHPAARVLRGVQ